MLTNESYASNEQTVHSYKGALKAEVAVIFPTVDITTSPAILFKGATVRHTDGKLYMSNGIAFEQIQGSDGGGSETAITIKQKYESNPDTNAYTDAEKSKLASITEIFTTVLKNAYDSTVTWITTNGSNLISHLSRTDNPHGVTKAQVGLGSVADGANMAKSVYDPTGINADAFDWNNFTNKPTIPSAQVNSDWSAVGGVAEILNKPTIPTIDPNTTIQGNDFNGVNQLVKLDGDGKLPAVDGSLLTGLPTEIIWLTDESFRPTVGVTDKAYVSKATGIIYRYDTVSGSYKVIGGGEGTPYMTATGTNTYIVTNTSAVTAYPKAVYMAFQNANTGASTIKIDALTTLPLKASGGDMPPNTVLAGAVKLLTLSSDSSHYQVQAGNIEVPAVATGEKVLTKKSDGIHVDYDVISATAGTATTGAYLSSLNWSTGNAAATGLEGEVRRYGGWKYECYADGNWKRYLDTLVYQDFILGTIDDSGGKKTSVQMSTAYPDAIAPQIVLGALGMYQYFGAISGWFYFENKI